MSRERAIRAKNAGFGTFDTGSKLNIHSWEAGEVPFLPAVAEVIADMWRTNLGIDREVIVGDATGIRVRHQSPASESGIRVRHQSPASESGIRVRRQSRELDGDFNLRSNEARFDGMSLA